MKSLYFTYSIALDYINRLQYSHTVKGLKKVAHGDFPGTSMKKIIMANESEINSLTISASTKTIFHTALNEGKIIFTPIKPVTYGAWNGLFYILIDFDGGSGSYIIGEGLNGGYSVCGLPNQGGLCNWTQNFFNILVPPLLTAGIVSTVSVSPAIVFVGNTIHVTLNFSIGPLHWTKDFFHTPTTPGTQVIRAQVGGGVSEPVVVKSDCIYGTSNCQFDEEINLYATSDIDGDLIKSIIQKESKFDPNAIRYEIHTDYNWYSKLANAEPQRTGWRGVDGYPEKHWRLGGYNVLGETFLEGD